MNGFSVTLPGAQVDALRKVPGVRDVYESASYAPQLDRSPGQIGAPTLWGPTLSTAGQGMKIGIIDSGVDSSHPFFDPSGYTMPPGFPKGPAEIHDGQGDRRSRVSAGRLDATERPARVRPG